MNEDTLFTPEQESQMGNIYDLKSHCPAIYFLLHSGAAIWNNDLLKLLRQMLQISRPEWVENEECEPRMHPRSDTHQEPKKSKRKACPTLEQEHRNIPVSSPCPQMSPLQESGNQRNVNSFRCPTTFEDFIWVSTWQKLVPTCMYFKIWSLLYVTNDLLQYIHRMVNISQIILLCGMWGGMRWTRKRMGVSRLLGVARNKTVYVQNTLQHFEVFLQEFSLYTVLAVVSCWVSA